MTDAGWARKKVEGYGLLSEETAATYIRAEHARSVRIVKAEIKRVKLDQYTFRAGSKDSVLHELQRILELLQRGRGGKG